MRTFDEHLARPRGLGALAGAADTGAAGGAACGDLVRFSVRLARGRVAEAGFDASGCGAMLAAGSAAVELVAGRPLLDAARVGADDVDRALDGLSPGKRHAAELVADALHRALGAAARRSEPPLARSPRRVLVAMSGGVDSAAAAQLAVSAGDDVVAVTLELWSDPATDGDASCCSPQAVRAARSLAHGMGIPHLTLDLREEFRAEVVEDYLSGYAAGRTPNPCVRCNGFVRFGAMLALADRLGAAKLATGHYARIARDEDGPLLRAGADAAKDQSYALARLTPAELERLSFPLGALEKSAVRALARDAGLPVADKRDSQDLCFLAGLGGRAFMRRHASERLGRRPGDVVDASGRVLGRHDGHHVYTVGQRRGLGVAAGEPLYVLAKDAQRNRVVVGPREALETTRVPLSDLVLHRPAALVDRVRLRYRAQAARCRLETGERPEARLERPVTAVAPGQVAVLMRDDLVLGCATIADRAP
jgi:tRNA-uridine 2-sulfurtransferase